MKTLWLRHLFFPLLGLIVVLFVLQDQSLKRRFEQAREAGFSEGYQKGIADGKRLFAIPNCPRLSHRFDPESMFQICCSELGETPKIRP